MNRYVAAGLLEDMRDGKQVLYVAARSAEAKAAFELVSLGMVVGERANRTNGLQSISEREGSGRIRFIGAASQAARATSADVLVIECDPTDAQLENLMPVIAGRGELLHFSTTTTR